ncbi:alpha/beta hydrolase [Deinococcus psychrotolerans]|uniref:Alpha/beta hydrolase n=1 Tax=Deinococcus psychrotolerans TaxID=2489213 RepID=A0A3G8YF15_9DEIO|nr:alpha/beta hydrolase [Deinococcus psychrotolerans]AZI43480.1 alpha/beta hydrolase [Deinococcus psychrotolerans]
MSQPALPASAQPWPFASGGPSLHGTVFAAPNERAAVLLTHGYAEHLGRYSRVIAALNQVGVSVYTYDQRGHGQSPGARAVVDMDVLVSDHLRAREALQELQVPLIAFGHSMGGLITAASVLRDPRGLAGVILSSPLLLVGEDESAVLKALSGVLGRFFPSLPVTVLESGGLSRLPEEVSAYDNDPQVYRGKVPALTAASMLRLSRQLSAEYPQWRLPTLVLHGTADRLADVRGSQRFAQTAGTARTPRPAIDYLEVEGGYHELFNDTVQAEVTAKMLAWVEQLLASQES